MTNLSSCETLVKLDRKLSRALIGAKGIKLTAVELELLAAVGMIDIVAESKARALKEQARCRQLRVVSTSEDRSGSISSGEPMGSRPLIDGISGGMMEQLDDSSAKARAQRMFG